MSYYDVSASVMEADRMIAGLNKNTYRVKLKMISEEMTKILNEAGQESNLPLSSRYFVLRNIYQHIDAHFTKE